MHFESLAGSDSLHWSGHSPNNSDEIDRTDSGATSLTIGLLPLTEHSTFRPEKSLPSEGGRITSWKGVQHLQEGGNWSSGVSDVSTMSVHPEQEVTLCDTFVTLLPLARLRV
jgi:hypothetical protein